MISRKKTRQILAKCYELKKETGTKVVHKDRVSFVRYRRTYVLNKISYCWSIFQH